jgi:response regulator RpfG family c-di-GMP phosphodiesterase
MANKPRVLCVADEQSSLDGLAHILRSGHEVVTAIGGQAGLDILARDRTVAVVISDFRMPSMDGASFFPQARRIVPDATRLLLSAPTDLESALAAVHEGGIFRVLAKPCSSTALLATVDAAFEQNRLVTAERVLLEQTLRGCVQMLTEVLALAAPAVLGQAIRIQRYARALASRLSEPAVWPIELASMLSQVGYVSLTPATIEKMQGGKPLTREEQQAVERLPGLAEHLVAGIPRLEQVRAALRCQSAPFDGAGGMGLRPSGKDIPVGARVLSIVCDFDKLESSGMSAQLALDTMRGRLGRYDPELLELFAEALGGRAREADVVEVPIRLIRIGMTFVDDVRTLAGTLLVARGQPVTESLMERFRNFGPGSLREPVRVTLKGSSQAAISVVSAK